MTRSRKSRASIRADRAAPQIPSEEKFARAHRKTQEEWRGVTEAHRKVWELFRYATELHEIYIWPHDDYYGLLIFFKQDRDIEAAQASGLVQRMVEATRDQLRLTRAMTGNGPTVVAELDSDENVQRKFNGNYGSRLR
jgi:hypothetical protein